MRAALPDSRSNDWIALALALALGMSVELKAEPRSELPAVQACFASESMRVPVVLELADAPSTRQKGLMGRTELPERAGMLFRYPELQAATRGFWMYRTLIGLDIAYLNEQQQIVSIRQMQPCQARTGADCPSYPAGAEFISAVEMNQGFFADHDIQIGDRLVLLASQPFACPRPISPP